MPVITGRKCSAADKIVHIASQKAGWGLSRPSENVTEVPAPSGGHAADSLLKRPGGVSLSDFETGLLLCPVAPASTTASPRLLTSGECDPGGDIFLLPQSAGVGRTGTFIVIDAMMDMIHAEQKVDVFEFVSRIRNQRPQMVQTDVSDAFPQPGPSLAAQPQGPCRTGTGGSRPVS